MSAPPMRARFAHRPELRDLGMWFYIQRKRIDARLRKAVIRSKRRRRQALTEN